MASGWRDCRRSAVRPAANMEASPLTRQIASSGVYQRAPSEYQICWRRAAASSPATRDRTTRPTLRRAPVRARDVVVITGDMEGTTSVEGCVAHHTRAGRDSPGNVVAMSFQVAVPFSRRRLRSVGGVVVVLSTLVGINLTANLASLPHREWIVPLSVLALVVVVKLRGMRWSELGLSLRHMPR